MAEQRVGLNFGPSENDSDAVQNEVKCQLCSYKSFRPDHLRRHVLTVHDKTKVICECCAAISPPGLSRHRKICPSRKGRTMKEVACNGDNICDDGNVCDGENVCDVKTGKIQSNYRVVTFNDGRCTITYDDIFIDGIKMSLVPAGQSESNGNYLKTNSIG